MDSILLFLKEKDMDDFIEFIMDEINEYYSTTIIPEYEKTGFISIQQLKDMFFYVLEIIVDDFIDFFGPDNDDDINETTHILQNCLLVFVSHIKESICLDDSDNIEQTQTQTQNTNKIVSSLEVSNQTNIEKYKKHIEFLLSIPQPIQRTQEWYEYRYNLITASNAYKALGSPALQNSLIYEKCQPLVQLKQKNQTNADNENNANVTTEMKYINTKTTLHWGQKYEPLSVMIYERLFQTKIQDFGCIPHSHYSFLGASPDGINMDESNPTLYGRMLEIKNIVNRPITGIPKIEYAVQMQLQMEVCDLDECDFLETKFKEFENEHFFYEDIVNNDAKNKTMKTVQGLVIPAFYGCIMQLQHIDSPNPTYIYYICDINQTTDRLKEHIAEWESHTLHQIHNNELVKNELEIEESEEKESKIHWIQTMYWKLEIISCATIKRDKPWFHLHRKQFESIWKTIEKERISGYEHRAPTRRVPKNTATNSTMKANTNTNTNKQYNTFLFSLTKETTSTSDNVETETEKTILIDFESEKEQVSSKKNQKTFTPKFDMSVFAFTDIEKTLQ